MRGTAGTIIVKHSAAKSVAAGFMCFIKKAESTILDFRLQVCEAGYAGMQLATGTSANGTHSHSTRYAGVNM